MEIIGNLVEQLFAVTFPFFGYSVTFGQVFVGGWLLALVVWFLRRVFE